MIFYAHKFEQRDGSEAFRSFAADPRTTALYGTSPIFKVDVREARDGETSIYWAWWENKRQNFGLIYPSRVQLEVCFAYGSQAEINRGRGRVVQVVVEEVARV